jgi:uncharacterized protein YjiS (DUF1127 family)
VRDDVQVAHDAWARHAAAANGFGDASGAGFPLRRPVAHDLWCAARVHRSRALCDAMHAAARAIVRIVRRLARRWRRERAAQATWQALRRVDSRTLRDLGFHPSELSSVAAEAHGLARITPTRVVHGEDFVMKT